MSWAIKRFKDGWGVVDKRGKKVTQVYPYHIQAQQEMLRLMLEDINAKQKQEAGANHAGRSARPGVRPEDGNPTVGGKGVREGGPGQGQEKKEGPQA